MVRTGVGAAVGGACGFAAAFLTVIFGWDIRPTTPYGTAIIYGLVVGAGGATVGAVIGGVGDILALLRKAFLPRGPGPEADYHDSPAA